MVVKQDLPVLAQMVHILIRYGVKVSAVLRFAAVPDNGQKYPEVVIGRNLLFK